MLHRLFVLTSCLALIMAISIDKADIQSIDKNYIKIDYKLYNDSGLSKVDIDSDLLQDLDDGLFLQIIIEKKINGNYQSFFKSAVIDRCHFAENRDKYPVAKAITEDFVRYGNMFQSCPVKKGRYYLKGLVIDPKDLGEHDITSGEYKIIYTSMKEIDNQKKILFSIVCFVTV